MNLDAFSKNILDDEKYKEMQQMAQKHNTPTMTTSDVILINLMPRTNED